MTADEIRAVWAKYLSGAALSSEEEGALAGAFEGDGALRREFLEDAKLHGLLRARKRAERDSATFEHSFFRRLEAKRDETRFIRRVESQMGATRGRFWRWLAAAAVALVALAGAFLFLGGEKPSAIARLESVRGTVLLLPERSRVASGQDLLSGQGLETVGAGSAAVMAYPDRTRLDVGGDAVIRTLQEGEEGKRVTLAKGTVSAVVTRQPSGRSMVFATPQGEAKVLGTTLRLVVDPDPKKGTTLEVKEGKVRLKNLAGKAVDVLSGHTAVAAAGVELVAKPVASTNVPGKLSAGVERVCQMPPNSWLAVPGTHLRRVVPEAEKYPKIQALGPENITACWSGGAFDSGRNQLLVWGGGPTQYHGNELYAFKVDRLSWERLSDPTADPVDGGPVNADGTPNARSTYGGLAYLAHAGRFFACGGDLAGSARRGLVSPLTWVFDFAAGRWENRKPSGENPSPHHGSTCAYDPVSRKLWWPESNYGRPGLYSYDYDANVWTRHNEADFSNGYQTSAVDTRRGKLVMVGNGDLYVYDLRDGKFRRESLKTTGGNALVAAGVPGLDYDPVADRIVGWAGGPVYALDLDTKVWTAYDPPGAPTPAPNGTFGRWQYVPSVGAFIVVNSIDENVHFFKLPAR